MSVGGLVEKLKAAACDAIDAAAADLTALSDDIWKHPELNFEEKYAHQILTDFLEKYGFEVSILNRLCA